MRGGTLIGIPDNALGEGNPNLLSSPEFAGGLADAPVRAGLVTLSSMAGYDNALAFGHDGSTLSYAYKTGYTVPANVQHVISVVVKMDDGNAPSLSGAFDGPTRDFILVIGGFAAVTDQQIIDLGAGYYRVSASRSVTTANASCGVVKYATNSSRTFKVTGYKLELGSVATPYTPQSILRQRGTYQDSAGTMPLSTVGEVLGLMTDRLGVRGPELNPDTTFSNPASWSESNADATHYSVISGNTLRYVSGTITPVFSVTGPSGVLPVGTYEVVVTCSQWTSGSVKLFDVSGTGPVVVGGAGTVRQIVTITTQTALSFVRNTANVDMTFSMLSVKRIPGNHATQPTPAQKPTLVRVPKRLGPNLVRNGTFDSGTTEWTQIGGVSQSASSGVLIVTSVGSAGGSFQDVLTQAATVKITVRARNVSGSGSQIWGLAQTGGFANPTVAAVYSTSWQDYSLVVNRISGASGVRVYITAQTNPGAIEVDSVEVQEVLEWTNAISFNGSSQFLNCGIATGNEGWLCAGVTLTSLAANQVVLSSGAQAAGDPGISLKIRSTGAVWAGRANASTVDVCASAAATVAVNTPCVIDADYTTTGATVRKDGIVVATSSAAVAAFASTNTLRIGTVAGTSPAEYLSASVPVVAICATIPTDAEREIIRKWMASTNRAPYWGELPTLSLDFVSDNYLISNGEI